MRKNCYFTLMFRSLSSATANYLPITLMFRSLSSATANYLPITLMLRSISSIASRYVLIILTLLFFLSCSKDPDILLTLPEKSDRSGIVMGYVYPQDIPITIELYYDDFLYDSTNSDIKNKKGTFFLSSIPFGSYIIVAIYNHMTIRRNIRVYDEYIQLEPFDFRNFNPMIEECNYPIGDTLRAKNLFKSDERETLALNLELYSIYTFSNQDTPVSIQPKGIELCSKIETGSSKASINIPIDSLLKHDSINLVINADIYTSNNSLVKDSTTITFYIDSTNHKEAFTKSFIKYSTILPSFDAGNISRESIFKISFHDDMDWKSVEENILINPACSLNFFWLATRTLKIEPSNSLLPQTEYTIILSRNIRTLDSINFRSDFHIQYTTGTTSFFSKIQPPIGNQHVDVDLPFSFKSNYEYDPILLKKAFTISPSVDSLFFNGESSYTIQVMHSELLHDTTYTITIDSSLSSTKGTLLGEDLIISFRTK